MNVKTARFGVTPPLYLDEFKHNLTTEMSEIMNSPFSQNTTEFITSMLNDLHNKFEDVDLDCDNYVTKSQFIDVFGEFYISSAVTSHYDGYSVIWNKMLNEQNFHYDHSNNMLYIPFILKHIKHFIRNAIDKLNLTSANIRRLTTFYDEILSLSLKLIYKTNNNDTDIENTFSEINTVTSFMSDSGAINITNSATNNGEHILIQKAIKSFIKLSNNFPVITKRKQLQMSNGDTMHLNDEEDFNADYLNLMNNIMAGTAYHGQVRVKKKSKSASQKKVNRKRYNLVSIDNNDPLSSLSSLSDEFVEIDVDESKVNQIYNEQKNKIFDRYIIQNLTMRQLMNAYQISIVEQDKRELILRAIAVFDSATDQNAPIYMKISKIKNYLRQRGLSDTEIKIAFDCSAASFEKITSLKLVSNDSINTPEVITEEQNMVSLSSGHRLVTTKRRNSMLVNNDLFYMKNVKKTGNGLGIKDRRKETRKRKRIFLAKLLIALLTFFILLITFHFGIAQVLTAKLYVNREGNGTHFMIDELDWNYLFRFENNALYEYNPFHSNDWAHLFFFVGFMVFSAYQIYFILNVVSKFKFGFVNFCYLLFCCCCKQNWYIERQSFATTHWFGMTVLSQIVLIVLESLRLLHFLSSKHSDYVFVFCINIGIACIVNGILYLLIIHNYINTKANNDIYGRKKTFIVMLLFEFLINFIFLLSPCIFILFSLNEYNFEYSKNNGFYLQIIGLFHLETFIDFMSTLFPIFLLLWHIFDVINVFEEKYAIVIIPNKDENTQEQPQRQRNNTFINQTLTHTNNRLMAKRTGSFSVTETNTHTNITTITPITSPNLKSQTRTPKDIMPLNISSNPNPFYEPSLTNQDGINLLHHSKEVTEDISEIQFRITSKETKKMVRHTYKTTKRLLFCCGIIGITFILYGAFVLVGVGYLYNKYAYNKCMHPSFEDISAQPSLIVWRDKCEKKLVPIHLKLFDKRYSQCDCQKFKWTVTPSEYIAFETEIYETYNHSITPQNVLQSVINDFTMLEIVYIEWYLGVNEQNITLETNHFAFTEIKALFLSNIAISQTTMFEMPQLEIISLKYMKWSNDAINASLITSEYLRLFSIENVIISGFAMDSVCSLSHLESIDISAALISDIPLCVWTNLFEYLFFNFILNLNGTLTKKILNRNERELIIGSALLYVPFNPIFSNEVWMCSNIMNDCINIRNGDYSNVIVLDNNDKMCRSALLWFQNIDVNSNGRIEEQEMKTESITMLMFDISESNNTFDDYYEYPMNSVSFFEDIWFMDANCSDCVR